MKKKLLGIGCLLATSAILLTGCTQPQQPTGANTATTTLPQQQGDHGKSLQVVTTFPPLYAHTANIIDENDTLTNLVPPGTSIHTWQPKPSDIVAMEQADVIITNGLGLEEFLKDYLGSLEEKGILVVDTSAGVGYIEFEEEDDDEHHEDEHEGEEHHDEHEDEHHHEGPDPHIWLDTDNAQLQVGNIAKALIGLDSTQEAVYKQNAQAYTEKLVALDGDISTLISSTTIEPFIVFHDAYQYFLQAYNLADKQVGLVQEFHGDNPSQKEIAKLIEIITLNKVTTIYTEPQFNPSIVKRLKQETGVKTREIDPIGSVLSKDGYVQTMKILSEAFANN